jgi:hypothetical protein
LRKARYALYAVVALALIAACAYVICRSRSERGGRAKEVAARAVEPGPHAASPGGTSSSSPEGAKARTQARRIADKAARAALLAAIVEARRHRLGLRRGGAERAERDEAPAGELDKEYIRGAVAEVIPEIRDCYEAVLKGAPTLEGTLNVSFSILGEPDVAGMIDGIAVDESSDEAMRGNAPLTQCVIDALSSLEFPPPKNGGKVEVRYPFRFEVDDGPSRR